MLLVLGLRERRRILVLLAAGQPGFLSFEVMVDCQFVGEEGSPAIIVVADESLKVLLDDDGDFVLLLEVVDPFRSGDRVCGGA